jgi:CubicO group peptidase (beta-lactamase class C family)
MTLFQIATRRGVAGALLLATLATTAVADSTSGTRPDPKSLNRALATWSQSDREFGFAHWDEVFTTRVVPRGSHVHALPKGAPLPGFASGGAGARLLNDYAAEYKLAGLVVVQDGKIRLERYGLGHGPRGRWTSFSMAKSITSTLVGAAIKDGFISSVDDPVTRYIPDLSGSAYDGVTVRQLLTMTSGAKWNEDYTDLKSDVALFYSTPPDPGIDATVSYMRRLTREAPPGEKWLYKTGETNLLGVLVSQATKKSLSAYASEKIWAPYGMEQAASWTLDVTDHEHGGCCFQATTRDYARLGQFILDGAHIDGHSIVVDGWFESATHKQADIGVPGRGYGYQWWTRDDQTFDAIGIHGQMIHIDPARRLVVAINSAWPVATGKGQSAARMGLVNAIAAAVDSKSAR